MLKMKCLRTADCVVGGFRYASGSRDIGSLLPGSYNDEGKLDHIGFTSAIAAHEQTALKKTLVPLRGGSGLTGTAPGSPSRWSTWRSGEWAPLKARFVAEVRYDRITANRFRHGAAFLRWRPDKPAEQCTFNLLKAEAHPNRLLQRILRA